MHLFCDNSVNVMTGLDLVMKYDLLVALAQHDIYPSDLISYTLDQLFTALKNAFGVNPYINCFYNKVSTIYYKYKHTLGY